jgi:hypothetical protein
MTFSITLIYNGVASTRDITTDPRGNVTIRNLFLQCGITRNKNERAWLQRASATKFRAKPLSDYSHLTKQHHDNATIIIAALMPSVTQLQLPLLPSTTKQNQPSAPIPTPLVGPILPLVPTPQKPRRPNLAAQKRRAAKDRKLRQIIRARIQKDSQNP